MARNPNLIRGVVRDSSGQPVSGARLYFVSGPVPLPDIAALTGSDGAFVLTAPSSGKYEIGCSTDEASMSVTVDVDGQDQIIEIRF